MATAGEAIPRDTGGALGEAEVSAVPASTMGWDPNRNTCLSMDPFPGAIWDRIAQDACLPADPFIPSSYW